MVLTRIQYENMRKEEVIQNHSSFVNDTNTTTQNRTIYRKNLMNSCSEFDLSLLCNF